MRMTPAIFNRLKAPHSTMTLTKKRPAGLVRHLSAPLKGLSRYAEVNETNPLLAGILTNWVVEDDRISVRPGYKQVGAVPTGAPIGMLVPHYGQPEQLLAAAGGKLYNLAGDELASGYGSDDWAWTSFSNLSDTDYTIFCNGMDGVVSWDGDTAFDALAITAPPGEGWINPTIFDKVLSHMNRLWLADSLHLAVYYLPLQSKDGALNYLPLNAIFRRGGTIRALATWTIDGGMGMDDQLVIFTSNGECAIYSGTDPESDFSLVGVFRFDTPMSRASLINYGGDLYVMIGTGLVPMTTLLRAEGDQLGKSDRNVMGEFEKSSVPFRDEAGWSVIFNSHTNHAICNLPIGNSQYIQLVRLMPGQVWSKWESVPARCWGWIDNRAYFGSPDGKIYQMGADYLNDNGAPIEADVRFAWSSYKSVSKKNFKMARIYSVTSGGVPNPSIVVETDYIPKEQFTVPEPIPGKPGAEWNTATWDVDTWAAPPVARQNWQGVSGLGRVGAPRIRVSLIDSTYAITSVDILYETGGVL
jgi:hypothetical protein